MTPTSRRDKGEALGLKKFSAYVSGVMYTHIMFVLQDPTNWECENKQQMKCNEKLPGELIYIKCSSPQK